ncbi:MAG: diguanylate cyclase [Sphingopyxis sp.]|uniref:sensor domain-containing diguanylate cyclase n=1 Tax=Sphingopyxis sp. TaxID=1908224 RepID=UPI003D80F2F4
MMRSLPSKVETPFWLLTTALGYFLLAALSLYATKGADNIAAIWPPSGFFLALLILMPERARIGAFAGAFVASFAANALASGALGLAAAFTLANMVEAATALWLINRRERSGLSFMVPRSIITFCLAALVASIASGAVAALLTGGDIIFFRSWLTTVALGMLIVTPPIVILARMLSTRALSSTTPAMKWQGGLLLAGTAALTWFCFWQSGYPLTFLPFVAVMIASFRLGPLGAASGVLIVALIASWLTVNGSGRIAEIEGGSDIVVLFLQFYLLVLLCTALPLAALLVSRQRLGKRLEQSNRWLLQAEAAALVGHWRVDLLRWTIQWSDQTYRVHGLEPGSAVGVDYSVEQYVDEDGAAVRAVLADAVRTGQPFEYQGRIRRADGQIRHVKSHGSIEMGRNGRAVGIFGTIQDVTDTVENARVLEAARSAAERVANTDMLTGLPNRRHTLAVLEDALGRARDDGAELAVAIFDIDHFKQINDQHGHAAGDAVIRRVAQRAKLSLRDDDMVGRFGGEEFVCIFLGPSARSATAVAERVRAAIEAQEDGEGVPKATVSIGLALYGDEATVEELLHRADEALYRAKREGRNRLRTAA